MRGSPTHFKNFLAMPFRVIHFRVKFFQQVSYYTVPRGFLLPWPPSCYYQKLTPFEAAIVILDALKFLKVHSSSPDLLTKYGPLIAIVFIDNLKFAYYFSRKSLQY